MRDLYSNDVETAAFLAREVDAPWDDWPSPSEYEDQLCAECDACLCPICIENECCCSCGEPVS